MPVAAAAAAPAHPALRSTVDAVVTPLMARDRIPGMAVGITIDGRAYVFDYGVASEQPRVAVRQRTLFEIGSITKTFTATLVSWAQVQHRLALGDAVATYLPALRGTPFGNVSLLSLGTHTPGGLPLQFPAAVTNEASAMRYFAHWKPTYAMGTYRTYSNLGIGVLGLIAATRMGGDFASLVQQRLLPQLGLRHTFVTIPESERAWYAQGYRTGNRPIRMTPGPLGDEAYGIRTTASDLLRFVQENIDPSGLPRALRRAIVATHTGYFRAGAMTQDLIWEQLPYPVTRAAVLDENSPRMLVDPVRVRALVPPQPPAQRAWLNKTGSTNGFGAYVAFVPSQRIGIVLLANRDFPIADRVTAAYAILRALAR